MNYTSESSDRSRAEGPDFASLTVPSRVDSIRPAAAFVVRRARAMNAEASSHALFEAAVVEALTNALKHGNTVHREDARIVCEVEIVDRTLTIRILDQGRGFSLPEPSPYGAIWRAEDASAIPDRGYGLSIIRSVFPSMRTISRSGWFGVELMRTF